MYFICFISYSLIFSSLHYSFTIFGIFELSRATFINFENVNSTNFTIFGFQISTPNTYEEVKYVLFISLLRNGIFFLLQIGIIEG